MSRTSAAAALVCGTPDDLSAAADRAVAAARIALPRFLVEAAAGDVDDALETFDDALAGLSNVRALARMIRIAHTEAANRATAESVQQELDKVITGISLDQEIFRALDSLDLSGQQDGTRTWIARLLRDMRLSGVDRDDETRARIRDLQDELILAGQAFDRTLASDTRTALLAPSALAGLPDDYVAAHPVGDDGLVRITTDYPDIGPFLAYSHDASARETLWRLNTRRGDPANIDTLRRLLELRYELAGLLGFGTWADYVTANKMIGSEQAIVDFIARISDAAADRCARDHAVLLERKRLDDPSASVVFPWDSNYLTDRVRAEQFAFDSQAVRPYFDYHRVKQGLMDLAARLFGIAFVPNTDVETWHAEVEAFDVCQGEELLGRIFLDMHPRADKFNHAAMFVMAAGKAGVRLPECALMCNFPNPAAGTALMQPSDVTTFFHEFGHLLHHIFAGRPRYAGIGGLSVEWDFIEAPSQLLEEWVRDAEVLATFAMHRDTGEPIPASLVETMRAADEFGKGMNVAQQMFYAELSLELHRRDPATVDPDEVEREAMERRTPFKHPAGARFHLGFGHLVGYSAMYYTYMWSLVIAKDLFTAFDPDDLLAVGPAGRYRDTVLAPGGAKRAADLVRDFLGREFRFDAYQAWLDS
jgi:Zn-dependent oligopeptidase